MKNNATKIDPWKISELSESFERLPARDLLAWTFETFGTDAAICTSFQVDGVVIIDIAYRAGLKPRIFTIDSGRLPQETHALIQEVRSKYEIDVEVYSPDADDLMDMVTENGVNLFYGGVPQRMRCCDTRKVAPLNHVLKGLGAWVTGLRRGQSKNREIIPKIQIDSGHKGILKINPLADWSEEQVWEYVKTNDVPTNALYKQGYTSIGCAPCTRPIEPGEDPRAGRWWWESDTLKECGIHLTEEQVKELTGSR